MENPSENSSAETQPLPEKSKAEWRDAAKKACAKITGRPEPKNFDEMYYLSGDFHDSAGRAVDLRLHELGKGRFMLYENAGKPLALLELRERFEQEGAPIEKLNVQASERTPEAEQALGLTKLT